MGRIIDATACVDPRAELGEDVRIGPFCVIGPHVVIGDGTTLVGHVCLSGITTIGVGNQVGRFCVLGTAPQDATYRDAPTRLVIGDHNDLRGHVTMSRGTEKEDGLTLVGSGNVFESGSHVAHDCVLGDGITMGTGVLLAGHVRIESHARLEDGSVVLQFVTVGGYSRAAPMAKIGRDLPPFMLAAGNPGEVRNVNAAVLKQHGWCLRDASALRIAHRLIFREKVELGRAEETLRSLDQLMPSVVRLLEFLNAQRAGRQGKARGHA